MKTIIFDGRGFADKKEKRLKAIVSGLKSQDITPHWLQY